MKAFGLAPFTDQRKISNTGHVVVTDNEILL